MAKNIIIVGSGFAGLMAALSASRLRHEQGVSPEELAIMVVAPEPAMVIRPRLYERDPETMVAPLGELFEATDVGFRAGRVETIDSKARMLEVRSLDGMVDRLSYDRLVLAAGSTGYQPPIPGLSDFGHSANDLESAVALDRHLRSLAGMPDTPARNTVVVAGGGFTGIEVASEMPGRLHEILGPHAGARVIIVERGQLVAPDMGPGPRPYIEQQLKALGIQTIVGSGIARIGPNSATLDNGSVIETGTVIWSAGMRASPLAAQLPGERDNLGRILVEADLRVPGAPDVFATGDTAKAATDEAGHFTLLSCQHARRLGAFAGYNAAADLLSQPTLPYDQPTYAVCLDLGPGAAIFTRGWSREVDMTGAEAKKMKSDINRLWIYPPAPDREAAYQNALFAQTFDV